jgi:hypothetical protein
VSPSFTPTQRAEKLAGASVSAARDADPARRQTLQVPPRLLQFAHAAQLLHAAQFAPLHFAALAVCGDARQNSAASNNARFMAAPDKVLCSLMAKPARR